MNRFNYDTRPIEELGKCILRNGMFLDSVELFTAGELGNL
jgi:hypothetical protein